MTETASSAVPADARSAYGYGVATIATGNGEATVLDVWYPAPALGTAAENLRDVAERGPVAAGHRRNRQRRRPGHRAEGRVRPDPPRRGPGRHCRRLPAPAPALAPPGPAQQHQPGRHLRQAPQRGVDQLRPRRRRGLRTDPRPAAQARRRHRLRRGQVPPHGRLRHPLRRPHCRRRPGPPWRAPRRRHHGHARRLRQLQRGHPGHVHGGRPHLRRRRRR